MVTIMQALETYIIKNWKTSAAGIALLGLAGLKLAGVDVSAITSMSTGSLILTGLAGVGLLAAKDASQ